MNQEENKEKAERCLKVAHANMSSLLDEVKTLKPKFDSDTLTSAEEIVLDIMQYNIKTSVSIAQVHATLAQIPDPLPTWTYDIDTKRYKYMGSAPWEQDKPV